MAICQRRHVQHPDHGRESAVKDGHCNSVSQKLRHPKVGGKQQLRSLDKILKDTL
jgi:hypothetical protein